MTEARQSGLTVLVVAFSLTLIVSGCSGIRPPVDQQALSGAVESESPIKRLAFLGEAILEGTEFQGTRVGGLSALTYDAKGNRYYALPDDPSFHDPTRIYELSIELGDGTLESGDVRIESLLVLRGEDGETLPTYAIDGEGLAISPSAGFFLSSEGNVERGIQPSILELAANGTASRTLTLPERYLSSSSGQRGARHNLAFEALTVSPEGSWLYAGIENALLQDGPEADLEQPSPARILRFDLLGDEPTAEYLYWVEPVPQAPVEEDGFRVNGLVEILALEGGQLLALERAFAAGSGNTVRLYLVDLEGADDIRQTDLEGRAGAVRPVRKTLLLDLAELGVSLDNLEGLTHGPTLADGRHTFLLISDDNFSPSQKTQVLAFAWSHLPPTLARIQGASHRSPLVDEWVFGVEGIVTAIEEGEEFSTVWLQSTTEDGDPSTSEAVRVEIDRSTTSGIGTGDSLLVDGRVRETARGRSLSTTGLVGAIARVLSRGNALPVPIVLGRSLPRQFDNDALTSFDPHEDVLDLFESLEGMRVEVPDPVVVGPPSRFGDFVVLAERGQNLGPRTTAGGILLTAESSNPQRLQIDPRLVRADETSFEDLPVGATFQSSLVGVLDYSFGSFEVVLTEHPGVPTAELETQSATSLAPSPTGLTIATFNVENLDALDSEEKYARVARAIAVGLRSPDIVGLQEIQDDNGAVDDGTVSATATLGRLVEEIVRAGGPRYDFFAVDPDNNADGGQPGANIRVAFLANPLRVRVERRGSARSGDSVGLERLTNGSVTLNPNPARVAATDPAFSFDEDLGYEASRKALALEVEFGVQRLFLINVHLKSKRGDDSLSGAVQPPVRHTEIQRTAQALALRSFVDEIVAADPAAGVVVLGDFNEHEFRPPLAVLVGDSLTNLILAVDLASRYTYNFRGNSQVLDHVILSTNLVKSASPEIEILHLDADWPAPGRASDHDPVIARLELSPR